jgi:hypothetical protein
MDELRMCSNPACDRAVRANFLGQRQSEYCCASCAQADRDGYEIHERGPLAHSPGCDQRHHEREGLPIKYAR